MARAEADLAYVAVYMGETDGSAVGRVVNVHGPALVARVRELEEEHARVLGKRHADFAILDDVYGKLDAAVAALDAAEAEVAEVAKLRAALREAETRGNLLWNQRERLRSVVGALWSCEACDSAPATYETPREGFRGCDEHPSPGADDLPWADALRELESGDLNGEPKGGG